MDPLPQVRFAADEKEVAELKAKLAKALAASDKAAADVKRTEELVKAAEAELAKRKDIAMRGRVTPDFLATAEAKVKGAKDAQEKATKEPQDTRRGGCGASEEAEGNRQVTGA